MRRAFKSEQGQSMVEFALVIPILLMILCGIIDFGWIFAQKIEINNSCREAARYAAVHYKDDDWHNSDATDVFVNCSPLLVSPDLTLTKNGEAVTISVEADAPLLTGLTSTFIGSNTVTVRSTCTMRIEG